MRSLGEDFFLILGHKTTKIGCLNFQWLSYQDEKFFFNGWMEEWKK